MKVVSLVLRIVAIVGALAAIALAVVTFGKVEDLEGDVRQLETEKSAAVSAKQDAENLVAEKESLVRGLQTDLDDARDTVNKFRSQLTQTSQELNRMQQSLRDEQTKLRELTQQKETLEREILAMQNVQTESVDPAVVRKLEDEKADLELLLREQKDKITDLEFELANVNQRRVTAAEEEQANQDGTSAAQFEEGATAQIIRIDAASGLLVLDRGTGRGITENMKMSIVKGIQGELRLQIASVEPQFALANILPSSGNPKAYAAGDTVELRP